MGGVSKQGHEKCPRQDQISCGNCGREFWTTTPTKWCGHCRSAKEEGRIESTGPEEDKGSLRHAIRLVVDAAETLSSAAGYEPDGQGGMNHRGMCQQELDAVEQVKKWLGPRPITPELRDAIITLGGKIPPGTKILEGVENE